MQAARKGAVTAPVADVNVFNEVVQAFNEREGVVPADGETPIAAASQQVQQDAASFLGHIVDALHDETCALRARVAPPTAREADADEDGWMQVRCRCVRAVVQVPLRDRAAMQAMCLEQVLQMCFSH